MGWLLLKKDPAVKKAGKQLDLSDLLDDPVIRFQKKVDPIFPLIMCFFAPGYISTLWGDNFWNGFCVAGGLRYVWVLHCTFLVNSAAHLHGDHPYDATLMPAENPFVSFMAIGEGWHNWHHRYPFDYSASEFGISSQFNPSKLFIDVMAFAGQAWDRKRATNVWALARKNRDNGVGAHVKNANANGHAKSDKPAMNDVIATPQDEMKKVR
jgi:stearoyl-CoA desaturase (delta-9 desaturase)